MSLLDDIILKLENSSTWFILAHERPDGDTLGCCSALLQRGVSMGKRCLWGGADPMPQIYSFLPLADSYSCLDSFPINGRGLTEDTSIIVIDTSNIERSVKDIPTTVAIMPIINIDHHGDNSRFGSLNWVDETASSAGEMIFDLFSAASWTPTHGEAEAIFVAISTDTGFFRFPSVTEKTLITASKLIGIGVKPDEIYARLYENRTIGGLHLWGAGLSRASLFGDGKICLTFLKEDDFSNSGTLKEEAENLVNALLTVSGVLVAVLLQEEKGFCRVSIRTRNPVNARSIAEKWGGGGHILAAGCKIQGSLSEVREAFILGIGEINETGISCN